MGQNKLFSAILAGLLAMPAHAGMLVELSAEASLPAANDLIRATLFSELSGVQPGELAQRVNRDIAEAIKLAQSRTGIRVQSGPQGSYPVYGQHGRIDSWRMRSEIVLESSDQAGISALIGQLQGMRLAVAGVQLLPAPETRKRVSDETIKLALQAFRARAGLIAGELGKSWRIRKINVMEAGAGPQPVLHFAKVANDVAMPVEAGESQVTASVAGEIELAD